MRNRQTLLLLFSALSFVVLLVSATNVAGSGGRHQRGEFIAAFSWSAEKASEYVWPFESMKPAPYESVRVVVEAMPRVVPNSKSTGSITLDAFRSLRINGRMPQGSSRRSNGPEEFRVRLERGRLRFSIQLPPGFRVDPKNAIVRIRLYQVN